MTNLDYVSPFDDDEIEGEEDEDDVKAQELGVPSDVLERHGAVSAEVAVAMAQGVRRRLGSDLGVGITGIAGPGADGTVKPIGLTYIAAASGDEERCQRFMFGGDRRSNREQASEAALKLLLDLRTGVRYTAMALDTEGVEEPC